ncbi:MAG: Asp-tRNA(Asn)/Glu-tRNA(Gln) amidotransferase subunit GatC [Methylobacillus sp.]|jgi:aspartyl-tRNA(Asn)/glutamyl-tRNA(Gln) amidotransferase subunit C|nr:Asp-tRNA(Asn)/Glu-tRNA(Gln) amidotransferase subunit GatC [Methylobacillus sp.]
MSLNLSDVKRIAHLARVEIDDADAETALRQLSGILGLIAEMQSINTDGITPMSHSQDITQRLRDDAVTETDQRALFQSVAPAVEGGLYLVPKVIE